MRYETLGRTGLKVSRLSFGASALGSVFRPVEESEGIRAVREALDLGINYFDVAPAYGGTLAETVLGKALTGIPRDRYYLSTKAGKFTDPEHYGRDELNYSRARLRDSIAQSMKRLGVDHFDIVHLHDFEYQRRAYTERALDEGMSALRELKDEGTVGAVSAGIYPMDLWHRIVASVAIDVALVHNHYCLNDTRALELLPAVVEKGIGLINGSPFGSGLLSGREPAAWHPAEEEDRRCFREAARFCERQGVPISKLAIQFASQHPQIPTTLFSSASAESVRRNVQWHEEPFDPSLLADVQKLLAPVRDKQWDYDAAVERLTKNSSGPAAQD